MSKLKHCMHQTGPVELLVPKLAMSPPRRGGEADPGNGGADHLPGDRGHKLNGSLQTVSKGAAQKYGGAFYISHRIRTPAPCVYFNSFPPRSFYTF